MGTEDQSVREDYANCAVPLDRRYSPVSMGLLWITMVSGFPSVLVGYEWHKAGFSLTQVIAGAFVSCVILLTYALSASHLGAATGLNFALLTRSVFGRLGSQAISAVQTFLFLVWYAMIAGFVAVELKGLFDLPVSTQCIAALAAIFMAANNLFGFAGVANFAKFFAAPVLIFWIFSLCAKTSMMTPISVWTETGSGSFGNCLSVISSFVIGYSVWGNEPDFWRFARPKLWTTAIPLVVSILIGQIVFPVSGWMLSRLVHVQDLSTATGAVTNFSFGKATLFAAVVLTASYFAAGDANLYGSINSIENLVRLNRTRLVLGMMVFTALVAVFLTFYGKAFEILSSFNSVVLPCVTVILILEYLYIRPKRQLVCLSKEGCNGVLWPAMVSLILGWIVGLLTAGVIHGTEFLHVGVWPLYAWLTSLLVYNISRQSQLAALASK
ncbi:MAG TPA: cytosine permease [Drouetiella sp.]|jgi:purine-cytosine permease-like protein